MARYSIVGRDPGQPRKLPSQPSESDLTGSQVLSGLGAANQVASLGGLGVPYGGPLLGALGLLFTPEEKRGDAALRLTGETVTSPGFASTLGSLFPESASGLTASGMTGTEASLAGGSAAAGSATGGLASSGVGLIDSLGPMVLWSIPSLASGLFDLINGNETGIRRVKRTAAAQGLGGDILRSGSLFQPVGGSTAGDALAAMLKYNLNNTFYQDTGHNWLPDPSLLPLQELLTSLGYKGNTEPKRGNVGGVGEIVAGSGPTAWEGAQQWENILRSLSARVPGQRFSLVSPLTGWQDKAPAGGLLAETSPDYYGGTQTQLTSNPWTSYSSVIPPPATGASPYQSVVVPDTNGGGNQTWLIPPTLSPEYLQALGTPTLATQVAADFQAKQDNAQAVFESYHNAP